MKAVVFHAYSKSGKMEVISISLYHFAGIVLSLGG